MKRVALKRSPAAARAMEQRARDKRIEKAREARTNGGAGAVKTRSSRPKGMARRIIRRTWTAARRKVDAEGKCRVCDRTDRKLEFAHIIGTAHDKHPTIGWDFTRDGEWEEPFYVAPTRGEPLCGPVGDSDTCHHAYDNHKLDLLPYLDEAEQLQAVADAGGIEKARIRTAPLSYPRKAA